MYVDAWRKYKESRPLEPVEAQIIAVLEEHPEYHEMLDHREQALNLDVATGTTNPFMHMGLHLALRDQIAIDRPPGIRSAFEALAVRRGRHVAEHAISEQLAEVIWQAERSGLPRMKMCTCDGCKRR